MKRERHTSDQIIARLREADAMLGAGATIVICQKLAVSEPTFHRWRNQYGRMKGNDGRRLKELEQENARLKKQATESGLENPTEEDLRRFDRNCPSQKASNDECVSPTDSDSRIAKMKDSTTHLVYKTEHAVDLENSLVLAPRVSRGRVRPLDASAYPDDGARESDTGEKRGD